MFDKTLAVVSAPAPIARMPSESTNSLEGLCFSAPSSLLYIVVSGQKIIT